MSDPTGIDLQHQHRVSSWLSTPVNKGRWKMLVRTKLSLTKHHVNFFRFHFKPLRQNMCYTNTLTHIFCKDKQLKTKSTNSNLLRHKQYRKYKSAKVYRTYYNAIFHYISNKSWNSKKVPIFLPNIVFDKVEGATPDLVSIFLHIIHWNTEISPAL